MDTPNDTPAATPAPPQRRRWPRRVAIGVAVAAALAAGGLWYLGRETTLQMIARRAANASGGKLLVSGVSGSLYGHMHLNQVQFRGETSVMTANDVDIDWKPWQYLSRGVEIDKLTVRLLRSETIKETTEPTPLPQRLAPPFKIAVDDARIAQARFISKGATSAIDDIRVRLHGDQQRWKLDSASATTPWGAVAAGGTIENTLPYRLNADASFSQTQATPGSIGAQLKLHAGGDLKRTVLDAAGHAARAEGTARIVLCAFEKIPLQALSLNARNIDPGFFNASLPTADLNLAVAARLDANQNIDGSVDLVNDGPEGTIDAQRLPLRALRGKLGGNLASMRITDVLLDLGAAGKFTGNGSVQRGPDEKGIGTARFALHTDRLDLKRIHGSMKQTAIAGDLRVANAQDTQTLNLNLADAGMRLVAQARLDKQVLTVVEARLSAGRSSAQVTGSVNLKDKKPFKANAVVSRFNPADFGSFPQADINADIAASGALAPQWQVAAGFTIRPSRLFGQPLTGRGRLDAGAAHVHDADVSLALGQNTATVKGSFGKPGEQLAWHVDGRQLSALRPDLYGALTAGGIVSGTIDAPKSSFDLDARGLGWNPRERKNDNGSLHASGEARLAGPAGARAVEVTANGTMQRLNPAAFGSPLAGNINGSFTASGHTGAGSGSSAGGALDLALQDSTLAKSPLWGHAKLAADKRHVSNADVDLHLGPNILAANGAWGSGRDTLQWRVDAPQLAALGPDFAGVLRGAGTLSGTMDTPSLSAALDGQNLKLMGTQQLRQLTARANLGAGHGAADPLAVEVQATDYTSGGTHIAFARLQSKGTRGAHTINAAARGDGFDALAAVRGAWNGRAWAGSVDQLQNHGRFAFTLEKPTLLRLVAPAGSGVMGLARPEQVALNGAVVRLPAGSITVESLTKNGPRWTSRGAAAGLPFNYLAQASEVLGENLRGDLTIGAQWALELRAATAPGAVPQLAGSVHVFREGGDLIAGSITPVPLGLRQLDFRADVPGGALRTQLVVDGAKIGSARVDATAQLIRGRIEQDSPLRFTANAKLGSLAWVSPLFQQPGLDVDGALTAAITGGGTIGAPVLNGTVNGDGLAVRWPDQGVRLRNGQLRAVLAGDQLQLERFAFEGNSGRALIDGNLQFVGTEARMNLKLVADHLEALSRPDRTVILSGQASVLRDATHFNVDGNFHVERALVELAPQNRPTISDDVIVLGRDKPPPPPAKQKAAPLVIDLAVDLGDDFHLRGMGADAYLTGTVAVHKTGDQPPRVNGTISTASGTYAAYGQHLTIDRGVITFSGAYDNPSLDILATRKPPDPDAPLSDTNVQAGVQVRGTALSPAARLVSTPNVSDSDKLSWLVLGHGMQAATGNEADVLSAAAGALLGGKGGTGGVTSKLANALGVDELGVRQGAGQASGLQGTVVTVGKRISQRLYLSFEQGAATATSVVSVRYRLTPKITLRLQTGTNTALDVLYSWAYD